LPGFRVFGIAVSKPQHQTEQRETNAGKRCKEQEAIADLVELADRWQV
jgi:hypothetical protein